MFRGGIAKLIGDDGIEYNLLIETGDFEINGEAQYGIQVLKFQSNHKTDPIDTYVLIEDRNDIFNYLRDTHSRLDSFEMYTQRLLSPQGATDLIEELKGAGINDFSSKTIYGGERINYIAQGTLVETVQGEVELTDPLFNHIFTFTEDGSCGSRKQEQCELPDSFNADLAIVSITQPDTIDFVIAKKGITVEDLTNDIRSGLYDVAVAAFFNNDSN